MMSRERGPGQEGPSIEHKKNRMRIAVQESIRHALVGTENPEAMAQIADGMIDEALMERLAESGVSQAEEAGYRLAEQAMAEYRRPKESKQKRVFAGLMQYIDAELARDVNREVLAESAKAMVTEAMVEDLASKDVWMREEAMSALIERAREKLAR